MSDRSGRRMRRGALALAGVLAAVVAVSVGTAVPASAHPLGNATVNHYDGLRLFPDHVEDLAVEDVAEIPTLQRRPLIDENGDGTVSADESARYANQQCHALAAADELTVDRRRLALSVRSAGYVERPGQIQLQVGRLECQLQADADLTSPASLTVRDEWDSAGIGWHEITAVGDGVTLRNSPFPAASISDALRSYPNDLLSAPLDQRGGTVTLAPGAGASTYAAGKQLPIAGGAVRALNRLALTFNQLVGTRHLTVGVGLLAVLLSIGLGAGHACLPGHGKTIMAAYLVGRRGRRRDVLTVGATVTLTHTAGVLILGLLISATAALAPTAVEQWLGVLSGLLVAGVGVGLLSSAVQRWYRRRPDAATDQAGTSAHSAGQPPADPLELVDAPVLALAGAPSAAPPAAEPTGVPLHVHEHDHEHATHEHEHEHEHEHPHPHLHPHGHGHSHSHGWGVGRHDHPTPGDGSVGFGRSGLLGLGVAGGLVPSPSALLVLLATIALGRTAFGVVLVLGYGLGMAAALTAAGLLLVRLRGRLDRWLPRRGAAAAARWLAALPMVTAGLVLLVGIGLTLRALSGTI